MSFPLINDERIACRGDVAWADHMPVHIHRHCPLWDDRISTEILKMRLADMGSREFARSHRQRAISDQDLLFKAPYLKRCLELGANHTVVERIDQGDYWDKFPRIAGVDLAISKKDEEAAFFVIFIFALMPDKTKWPLYMYRERGVSFGKQVKLILDLEERFRCQLWMVESNSYQEAIIDHLSERPQIVVQGVCTGADISPNDLDVGLPSMATEFEHGHWVIPQGDARSIAMMEPWLEELGAYPNVKFKDTVMASFFAREGARQGKVPKMRITVVRG
jgi:hypothetical protein